MLIIQKQKEDLEDVSNELELADEDDLVPCAPFPTIPQRGILTRQQLQDRRLIHLIAIVRSAGNVVHINWEDRGGSIGVGG